MTTGASLSDLPTTGKAFEPDDASIFRVKCENTAIAVWQTRLDRAPAAVSKFAETLSIDETLRAQRFRFEVDRRRFVVARGVLRQLLANVLSASPAKLVFGYTKSGKPYLEDMTTPVYFNVSHSEDCALFAISGSCQPGIDIECLNRAVDFEPLALRFFTGHEYAALMQCAPALRKQAFLELWTCKEAAIKAVGDGLTLPLHQFEVTLAAAGAPQLISQEKRYRLCTLYPLSIGDSFVASLAAYSATSTKLNAQRKSG